MNNGDNNFMEMVFMPKPVIQENLKIKRMVFHFDPEKKEIQKVINYYTANHLIDKQTTTYYEVNYDYKGSIARSAYSRIFTNSGKLLPQYAGYELIDNRTQN